MKSLFIYFLQQIDPDSLLKAVTSVGHAAVDQLVHQVVVALSGGSLVVVEV